MTSNTEQLWQIFYETNCWENCSRHEGFWLMKLHRAFTLDQRRNIPMCHSIFFSIDYFPSSPPPSSSSSSSSSSISTLLLHFTMTSITIFKQMKQPNNNASNKTQTDKFVMCYQNGGQIRKCKMLISVTNLWTARTCIDKNDVPKKWMINEHNITISSPLFVYFKYVGHQNAS